MGAPEVRTRPATRACAPALVEDGCSASLSEPAALSPIRCAHPVLRIHGLLSQTAGDRRNKAAAETADRKYHDLRRHNRPDGLASLFQGPKPPPSAERRACDRPTNPRVRFARPDKPRPLWEPEKPSPTPADRRTGLRARTMPPHPTASPMAKDPSKTQRADACEMAETVPYKCYSREIALRASNLYKYQTTPPAPRPGSYNTTTRRLLLDGFWRLALTLSCCPPSLRSPRDAPPRTRGLSAAGQKAAPPGRTTAANAIAAAARAWRATARENARCAARPKLRGRRRPP